MVIVYCTDLSDFFSEFLFVDIVEHFIAVIKYPWKICVYSLLIRYIFIIELL